MKGRCSACGRIYEISDEFIAMGGRAKCPHCLVELTFANTQQAKKRGERFLETTKPDPNRKPQQRRVETGGKESEVKAYKTIQFSEREQEIAGVPVAGGEDVWGGKREIKLPELQALLAGQQSEPQRGEESPEQLAQDVPEKEEFLRPPDAAEAPPPEMAQEAEEGPLEPVEVGSGGEEASGEDFETEEEQATELQERPVFDLGDESEVSEEAEWPAPEHAPEEAAAGGAEAADVAGEDFELGSIGSDTPADEAAGLLEPEHGEEPVPTEQFEKESQPADESYAKEAGEGASSPAAEPSAPTSGAKIESQSAIFTGLASTDDWAQAAARWAESGFSPDAIPSFIKKAVPEKAVPDTKSDVQKEISKAIGELAEKPDELVEISDSDIVADEGQLAAAIAQRQEAVAATDLRVERPAPAPASRKQRRAPAASSKWIELLTNPISLAVAGVVILASAGIFFWVVSQEDVEAAVFPPLDSSLKALESPPPAAYKTTWEAVEHYGLGNRLAHQGSFEDAVIEYKQAARLDPAFPLPHRALGSLYAVLGNAALSAASFETYLRLAPQAPDAEQVRSIVASYPK